jgi:hypothetical protein
MNAGTNLIIAESVSIIFYLTLTTLSVFKPWVRTARGIGGGGAEWEQRDAVNSVELLPNAGNYAR